MSQPAMQFAEPPIGADGFIDIAAVATRIHGAPEVRPSGIDLEALDAATPAASFGPFGPFGPAAVAPTPPPPVVERPSVSDHELLVAEVAAGQNVDPTLPEGACRVDLKDRGGETVIATFVVLHADDWPASANAAANDPMQWFAWAMKVLATDDDKDLWRALDPTNRQVRRFIDDWQIASGNIAPPKGQR